MVKKYMGNPEIIEAIQYTGDNMQEILDYTGKEAVLIQHETMLCYDGSYRFESVIHVGDYIIKDGFGDFKICGKRQFEDIYEYEEIKETKQ